MSKRKECIKVCNSLLRGEMSAVETYDQAIETFAERPEASTLRKIRDDHVDFVNVLRQNIREMGGIPSSDSGTWGEFARAIEGSASALGESAALHALIAGESLGTNSYCKALENEEVLSECKKIIKFSLLPRQESHVGHLEQLRA